MTVAGIDFSTKAVDIVLLDEDTDAATWVRVPLFGQDAFDRARAVKAAMPGGSFWDDVLAVGIEQPRGNFGTVHIARIQGAVLACLPRPLLVQPWNPAAWRKTVGLPGNASKADVAWWADSAWPNRPSALPQDALDAFCIALATRLRLQRSEAA